MGKRLGAFTLVLFVVLTLSGCVGPHVKPAQFISQDFQPQIIDCIYILPAMDGRLDKSLDLNWNKVDQSIHIWLQQGLKQRGYQFKIVKDRSLAATLTREDLQGPDGQRIRSVDLPEARWLLFLMIDDTYMKTGFGGTGSVELTGFLWDKTDGKLLWKHKAVAGGGGLGLMNAVGGKAIAIYSNVEKATWEIRDALPLRTQK